MTMVWFMEFNGTFNNILAISRRSVLLMEETGVPRKNHRPVASDWQPSSHNIVSNTYRHKRGSNSHFSSDCTDSCKSNYHAITTRTVLRNDNGKTPSINHHMINSCFAESESTVLIDQGYDLTNGTTNCSRRVWIYQRGNQNP